MRWQSSADNREPERRERFSTPLTVAGIFCSFLFVLVLLYPEQGLLGVLAGGDDVPATIRYREAVLRMRPGDTELRLKVAGSLLRTGQSRRAREVLSGVPAGLTASQKRTAAELNYGVLLNLLGEAGPGDAARQELRVRVARAAGELAGANPPARRLRQFAADARKVGDEEAWQAYSSKAEAAERREHAQPGDPAAQALSAGDFRGAAAHCFDMMRQADTLARRREYFIRGVRALQSGNLPREAFDAGERHLDGLADDRATLIFLTRAGLAAGEPGRAQRLIRRALGTRARAPQSTGPS